MGYAAMNFAIGIFTERFISEYDKKGEFYLAAFSSS